MNYSILEIVIELLLTGVFFHRLMPRIKGARFEGSLVAAFLYAALFQVVMLVVAFGVAAATIMVGLATLGGAFLVVPFAILFGIWFFPALGLKAMALLFPNRFAFRGTQPLLLSGLAITLIIVTSWLTASLFATH